MANNSQILVDDESQIVPEDSSLRQLLPSDQKSDCECNLAESSFVASEESSDYSDHEPSGDEESIPQNDKKFKKITAKMKP